MQETVPGLSPDLTRRGYAAIGPAADNGVSLLHIGDAGNRQALYSAIHAVQLSRIRRVPSRLVLAGCGAGAGDLRSFARGLRVDDDVLFIESVFETEKQALFGVSDALLVLDEVHHVPHSVRQAAESGLRVVALRNSAIGERLREGVQTLLLPAPRPHLICDAIITLARSRRVRRAAPGLRG